MNANAMESVGPANLEKSCLKFGHITSFVGLLKYWMTNS
jgi:hypothetical protein